MKIKCKKTTYARKGSTVLQEPSFIEGKVYEAKQQTFYTGGYMGLGDYEIPNERGSSTIYSSKKLLEVFEIVEE